VYSNNASSLIDPEHMENFKMAILVIDLNDSASEIANPFGSITKDKNYELHSMNSDSKTGTTYKSTNYLFTNRNSEVC
jgi:hypothetical protein